MIDTAHAADAAPVVPALNVPAEVSQKQETEAPSKDAKQAEPEANKEGNGNEDQVEKPKRKASERISELYGRTKAAERERDAALADLHRLRSQQTVPREQFDQMSFDEQQRAIVRDAVREERAAEIESEAHRRHAEAEFFRAQQYRERMEAAQEVIPDLAEKLSDPTLPISEYAAQVIADSELGPQMAYWLANNRADAQRISRLHPTQQAYELGKIEARLAAAPTARKVSQAPAPVPMVGGGGGAGAKDPSAMSMSEYIEWRKSRKA